MRYVEMLRDPPVALLARRGANFTLEKDIPEATYARIYSRGAREKVGKALES